jgi:hypothetical protein
VRPKTGEAGVDEKNLADVVATAYGAASGANTWFDFGVSLCQLVDAQRSSLRLVDGTLTNLLGPSDAADAAYLAHYHRVDPYRSHAAETPPPPANTARLGWSIIPMSELRRTEYFTDYAARYGQHYMLGGKIGLHPPLPIGLHRDAASGAFTDVERQLLEKILPHLQRALQLRERLALGTRANTIGTAALDALSACVVVVDGTMQVLHVNEAGAGLTSPGRSGLTISRAAVGSMQLSARQRDDNDALRGLVAGAASGGAGGAIRVRARSGDVPEEATLAVLVSPVPAQLVTAEPGLARGLAMIVARELSRPEPVPGWRLSELYGLTSAEAAVAAALVGGISGPRTSPANGLYRWTLCARRCGPCCERPTLPIFGISNASLRWFLAPESRRVSAFAEGRSVIVKRFGRRRHESGTAASADWPAGADIGVRLCGKGVRDRVRVGGRPATARHRRGRASMTRNGDQKWGPESGVAA